MNRATVALLFVSGLWAAACGGAAAQSEANWPTKPIRAILPIAPGTGADVVFRLVLSMSCRSGSASRSSSRTTAARAARSASAAVAKADPDGYTILAQSTSHAIAPSLYPNMPYDVTRDFAAVVPFGKHADRAGDRAVEGHQDRAGVG